MAAMPVKKIALFVVGGALVIGGVALTLQNWLYLQIAFKAVIGPVLAVAGLVALTMTRD